MRHKRVTLASLVHGFRTPRKKKHFSCSRGLEVVSNHFLFFTQKTELKCNVITVSVESQLWIIDTDYDNYLIVNGCDRASDAEENELFWIYSRDKEIDSAEVQIINDVLKAQNFERSKIIRHRHGADM